MNEEKQKTKWTRIPDDVVPLWDDHENPITKNKHESCSVDKEEGKKKKKWRQD